MSDLNFSFDYLNEKLREQHVFDISKVNYAVLEPNGKLSVQLKPLNRPLTPRDINISVEPEGTAVELILDGKLLEINLQKRNLNVDWLKKELHRKGINEVSEVAFAALSTNGKLYVDLFKDEIN